MRYTDFAGEFVRYLYRDSVSGSDFVNFADLAAKNEIPYEQGFLVKMQRELKDQGFLIGPNPMNGDATAIGSLTGAGLRYVESIHKDDMPQELSGWRELRATITDKASAEIIPASDRIVRLDHNSAPVVEILDAAADLQQKIRMGNDIGDLTHDEAVAAAGEVSQLEQAMKADFVRPDVLVGFAKKTLKWVGEKAAGAAVGKAALALLVMIAAFFGIDV